MKKKVTPKIKLIDYKIGDIKKRSNYYRKALDTNIQILKILDNKKKPLLSDKEKLDAIREKLNQDLSVKTTLHLKAHIKELDSDYKSINNIKRDVSAF